MPRLATIGRQFGARALALENGYKDVLEGARAQLGHADEAVQQLGEFKRRHAENGLLFLDELKKNLYGFSQELNRVPNALQPASDHVKESMVPVMDTVLTKAEIHLAMLKQQGMDKRHGMAGMGVWYNPATWLADAETAVAGAVVKTAFLGLGIYAAVKLISKATKTKK